MAGDIKAIAPSHVRREELIRILQNHLSSHNLASYFADATVDHNNGSTS